ncbi:hypothetical protein AYI68_g8111 [Smittium mucronatum]|uniref:LYC1 C-terminal domain-containing protein n=1 Tax=Smittium mucronatum TaxID=133383 RepID=A0A1R0GLS4_9FUNG|nr:hypothetical protein AYI68_g8111 [Smittium mucronatum]
MTFTENFEGYELIPANIRSQVLKARIAMYREWGVDIMDEETWQKREDLLESLEFIKGNLTTWIFGLGLEDGGLDFHSQFETIRRPVFIKRKGSKNVEILDSLCIPTYTCDKEFRGKGLGIKMLQAARSKMQELCSVSILHSDVGSGFYSRYGWDSYPLISTKISVASNQFEKSNDTLFFNKELARIISLVDSKMLRTDMSRAETNDSTVISVVPEFGHYEWRNVRDNFEGQNCLNVKEFSENYGVLYCGDQTEAILRSKFSESLLDGVAPECPSFIMWTHRFKENSLLSLRARINHIDHIVPLINAALQEAKSCSLSKIEFWNFQTEFLGFLEEKFNVESIVMKKSLPCLALFDKNPDEKIEWLLNEQVSFV